MPTPREFVEEMKEIGRVLKTTYFKDVEVYRFLHEISAVVDDNNMKRLRMRWKDKYGVEFDRYEIKDTTNKYIVYNNDNYGYNLLIMQEDLNHFKIDHIWIPNKRCPCYVDIGDGHYYVMAPIDILEPLNKDINLRVSKPQKSLSSFW